MDSEHLPPDTRLYRREFQNVERNFRATQRYGVRPWRRREGLEEARSHVDGRSYKYHGYYKTQIRSERVVLRTSSTPVHVFE